ncbi:MAG TPA: VOC family protein [Gemmatimonadaceae bacterium]|nr:VOC family protein [Gemmatimonadaceae bacterium]
MASSGTTTTVRKLTPVLVVEHIEPSLQFWTERLGFEKTVEVPEGDRLGFVILVGNGVEIMYQSRASVQSDVPAIAAMRGGEATALFVEVADIGVVERAMADLDKIVPRRTTFYGMEEIGVREPGGHVVIFAQPAAKA